MELLTAFTLFGYASLFIVAVVALFIAFIAFDIAEVGTGATVSAGIFIGLNYFWGNFPIESYISWQLIGMYVFIGLLFAILRTYFKGKELTKKYNVGIGSHKNPTQSLEQFKKEYDLKSSVFRWWFLFPISAITWLCGTLLRDAWDVLYAKVGTMFYKILNA